MLPILSFFRRFFSENPLDAGLLEQLSSLCTRVQLSTGDIVFDRGEQIDAFYWVSQGQVALRLGCKDLIHIGAGRLLGEDSVFSQLKEREYAAIAIEPVELIRVEAVGFMKLVEQHPKIAMQLLKAVAHQHQTVMGNCAEGLTTETHHSESDTALGLMEFIPNITFAPQAQPSFQFFVH